MPEIREWSTAPKTGVVINVKFSKGKPTKAKYDTATHEWKVIFGQRKQWKDMEYVHQGKPVGWWPDADWATGSHLPS